MSSNPELMRYKRKSHKIKAKMYEIGSVDVHWHDFYEIELVLSGEGTHLINNTEYEWRCGEIHFLKLTDFHKINLKNRGLVHLIQIPSNNIPDDVVKMVSAIPNNIIAYLTKEDFAYVNALCKLLESNVVSSDTYNEGIVNKTLSLIVDIIVNAMKMSNRNVIDAENIENRMATIIMYMNEHFTDDLNLEKIANRFYISKSHLCYYFKNSMGTTVLNYLKDLRLAHAAKLAVTTQKKSIDIGLECGYDSVSNFLRDFKKKYGVSPMTMRKQNNNLN